PGLPDDPSVRTRSLRAPATIRRCARTFGQPRRHVVIVRTLVLALMMGALTACASAGGGSGSTRTDRDRLSREELAEYPGSNLYDVIRSQRPAWLRDQVNSRLGQTGAAGPMIYLDGQPFGEIEAARSISTQSVETV